MIKIEAEMSGHVWKILAEVGTAVDAGAPLMVLESMKMEIPVTASTHGTVAEIGVSEGDAVAAGQFLIGLDE